MLRRNRTVRLGPTASSGCSSTSIGVTVHEDKVKQDEEKAQKALKSAEEKVKGEIKSLRNK